MKTNQLKSLVKFMKAEKVLEFSMGDIKVTFAPAAFIPKELLGELVAHEQKTDEQRKKEEEDVLYHSSS